MFDLDCHPKPKMHVNTLMNKFKEGGGSVPLDGTLKSSYEHEQAIQSLSSGTSYGREPVFENTIDQILGNIERNPLGQYRDSFHDSYD